MISPKILGIRVIALPIIATVVALLGGISATFYGAAGVAFLGALVFTMVSERLLRQKLMGKIGGSPISWYFVHLVGETATFALLTWGAFAIFGWSAAGWVAIAGGVAIWLVLTWDTLASWLPLIPLWLATRR